MQLSEVLQARELGGQGEEFESGKGPQQLAITGGEDGHQDLQDDPGTGVVEAQAEAVERKPQ